MYYKVPLDDNLSNTSYRATAIFDGIKYIEYNDGVVGEHWIEISEEELKNIFGKNPFVDEPTPEPTQADRIEANLDYLVLLNS